MGHGLPRTRGDGPALEERPLKPKRASPHTRGWTLGVRTEVLSATGFPAHAGMDPRRDRCLLRLERLPRTRGDGPD